MIIGIIGNSERQSFWEQHLRHFATVREVILTDSLPNLGKADACILLDGSYEDALRSLRRGYATFFVSRLLTDSAQARKLALTSEEAGVPLMITNWALFSSVSQWMLQRLSHPEFIHIHRSLPWEKFQLGNTPLESLWTEELALCLKWIDSSINTIQVSAAQSGQRELTGLDIFARFDNRATASIHLSLAAQEEHYTREASGQDNHIWADVLSQKIRWGRTTNSEALSFLPVDVNRLEPAKQALQLFLIALQTGKPALSNAHDLLRFAVAAEQVKHHIHQKISA